MPLIVWSYPRGCAVDDKGGKDSFYEVDYAARTASELGADVVKVNFPHPDKQSGAAEPYLRDFTTQQAIDAVVRSANRTLLLVSGGERAGDEAMLEKARQSMEAGRHRPDLRPQRLATRAQRVTALRRASSGTSWPSTRPAELPSRSRPVRALPPGRFGRSEPRPGSWTHAHPPGCRTALVSRSTGWTLDGSSHRVQLVRKSLASHGLDAHHRR